MEFDSTPPPPSDAAKTITATVSGGTLRGTEHAGIWRFLGIPYAAPPFGSLRFRPPVPAGNWEGVRDATGFSATAPQRPYTGEIGELLESTDIPGDDILTVNVWAPAPTPNLPPAPVVVWYHGGALERGTPALAGYDGSTFARDGIVFVSVGYRLGAEGFSVLEGAPLNLGLQDAAAGLAWVRAHIAAFGGNPNRITIMGESAGGALVAALLSRPDTAALVAGAVIQSGPLLVGTAERAGRVTRALAKKLGISPTSEAFSRLTPDQLLDARTAQSAGSSPLGGAPGYALALDPETLPVSPHKALRECNVPILMGSNTDEYRLWFSPKVLAGLGPLKRQLALTALRVPRRATAAYRKALPDASPAEVLGQIVTDLLLRRDLVETARQRAAPSFVYEFAWQSPVRDLRAAHALEIAFAFDCLDGSESVRLAGTDAPQPLADEMHERWVTFIATGDPGWPAFSGGGKPGERATAGSAGAAGLIRRFDQRSSTVPLPRSAPLSELPAPRA